MTLDVEVPDDAHFAPEHSTIEQVISYEEQGAVALLRSHTPAIRLAVTRKV
jgi:hypothetical protein